MVFGLGSPVRPQRALAVKTAAKPKPGVLVAGYLNQFFECLVKQKHGKNTRTKFY